MKIRDESFPLKILSEGTQASCFGASIRIVIGRGKESIEAIDKGKDMITRKTIGVVCCEANKILESECGMLFHTNERIIVKRISAWLQGKVGIIVRTKMKSSISQSNSTRLRRDTRTGRTSGKRSGLTRRSGRRRRKRLHFDRRKWRRRRIGKRRRGVEETIERRTRCRSDVQRRRGIRRRQIVKRKDTRG